MGGKGGSDEQEVTNTPWAGVQGPLSNLYSTTQSALGATQPYYPGQTFPNFTPLQEAGMAGNLDYAQNYMAPATTGYQSQLGQYMDAPLNISQDPAVQAMMGANERMVNRNLTENMLPSIRGGALNAGAVGGSRQGIAEGLAMRGSTEALANANAQTMLGAYGTASDLAGRGATLFPGALQMGMMPGDLAQQYGGAYQQLAGQQIGEQMNRYSYPEQSLWDKMATAGGIYSGAGNYGTQTSDMPGTSPVAGAIGGGMAGYGLSTLAGAPTWLTGPAGAVGGALLGALLS